MHRGFGFALLVVVLFVNTPHDTVCEQHISAAEFWRVVGKSGADGRCWLDGDRKCFGKWFGLT